MTMKKQILRLVEFRNLGFEYQGTRPLDNDDFFRWWILKKNDSELHITYEYNSRSEFTGGCVDFNCEKLQGKELKKKDIEFLIRIM
jgi:hypothetical protein